MLVFETNPQISTCTSLNESTNEEGEESKCSRMTSNDRIGIQDSDNKMNQLFIESSIRACMRSMRSASTTDIIPQSTFTAFGTYRQVGTLDSTYFAIMKSTCHTTYLTPPEVLTTGCCFIVLKARTCMQIYIVKMRLLLGLRLQTCNSVLILNA